MGCVLRIFGDKLDVDSIAKKSTVKPYSTFKKGEPMYEKLPGGRKNTETGLTFVISKANLDDLYKQQKDAIKFLSKHKNQLKKITTSKYVKCARLDFGINLRIFKTSSTYMYDMYPHELLKLLADLRIDLETSIYPF
jgi:hypothetical protein